MPKNKNSKTPKSDDDSSDYEDENVVLDKKEYKKLLNSLFPSKYMEQQIAADDNAKDNKKANNSDKNKENKKKSKKDTKSKSKKDSKSKSSKSIGKNQNVEMIFTILPPKNKQDGDDDIDEDEYEEYDSDDSSYVPESDESDESSEEEDEEEDEEESDEKESDEEEEEDDEEESDEESEEESDEEDEIESETESEEVTEEESDKEKKVKYNGKLKKQNNNDKSKDELFEKFQHFMKSVKSNKKNNAIQKEFLQFEKQLQKKKNKIDKKRKSKNVGKYTKLISNKSLINDVRFFKDSLNINEQEKMLEELEKVKSLTHIDKPYRIQLLENKNIPDKFKAIALKKINAMKLIADGGGEYNKLKNWVDTFMRIPFNQISTLPVTKEDSSEKIHEFMDKSQKILDEAVYGMKDAKIQFMQMVAQWVANPNSIGNAIAIKGPMGTGKTTLIKYGVSKLLNREFAFIPLGGATDSSYLEGHSYTYEGSTYGKIVDILIQCKSSNPVIYFDELDKVSDSPKGEEIIGILTHLTDTTQNDKFHDRYFSEIDFNLSKCLFIFSYNDESKINPILKDRMYNIETKGYDSNEKVIISNNYLIPKLENELNMDKNSVQLNENIIKYIIDTYTNEEKGVRNLKRCLEIIYSKINLYTMMKPGSLLFGDNIIENISFPFEMNEEVVQKIIKKENNKNQSHLAMYL